jgi:nucleolar GTP-binding protein
LNSPARNINSQYDIIPEIMDGKNIADFIDPEIEEKLDALEREEERLIAERFSAEADEMEDDEQAMITDAAAAVKLKKDKIIGIHRANKGKTRSNVTKKTVARVI